MANQDFAAQVMMNIKDSFGYDLNEISFKGEALMRQTAHGDVLTYFLFEVKKRRQRTAIWQPCIWFPQLIKKGVSTCIQL